MKVGGGGRDDITPLDIKPFQEQTHSSQLSLGARCGRRVRRKSYSVVLGEFRIIDKSGMGRGQWTYIF